MELFQDLHELSHLLLPFRSEHVVGLHVENIVAGVCHVIDPEDKDLSAGRRGGCLRCTLLRECRKRGGYDEQVYAVQSSHESFYLLCNRISPFSVSRRSLGPPPLTAEWYSSYPPRLLLTMVSR